MFWLDLTEKLTNSFFSLSTLHFSLHLPLYTAPRTLIKCIKCWSKTPESAAPAHKHLPDFWSAELWRADLNQCLCGELLMQCPQPCKSLQVVPAQARQSRQHVLECPASTDIPALRAGTQRLKLYPKIWWHLFICPTTSRDSKNLHRWHLYVKAI